MKPRVHDLGDAFAERNMFLQVGLGLISLCLRFEDLVARQGTLLRQGSPDHADEAREARGEQAPPVLRLQLPGQPAPGGGPAKEETPVVDFLLGLAAFSQRLLLHAEEAGMRPPPADRRGGERRYFPRGLLE